MMQVQARLAEGQAVTLGIRPEHVREGDGANPVEGRVAGIEQLGASSTIRLEAPELLAVVAGQTRLRDGDRATVSLPPEALHVFDAEGRRL